MWLHTVRTPDSSCEGDPRMREFRSSTDNCMYPICLGSTIGELAPWAAGMTHVFLRCATCRARHPARRREETAVFPASHFVPRPRDICFCSNPCLEGNAPVRRGSSHKPHYELLLAAMVFTTKDMVQPLKKGGGTGFDNITATAPAASRSASSWLA